MAILIMSHPAAAVAAGMPAVSVVASATVAGPWYRRSDVLWPLAATVIVLVGYAISIAIWQATHAEPIRVNTEFSAFALLYIATQATERLLEPFASFVMTTGEMKSEMEQSLAGAMTAPEDHDSWSRAAEAKERLDQRQRARAYVMWAAATVIGMIASAALGVYVIAAIAVERGPAVPIDILVTGLVIGGGTKPLHDLIARIERAKQQANVPGSG
jgi:hypothetical protein